MSDERCRGCGEEQPSDKLRKAPGGERMCCCCVVEILQAPSGNFVQKSYHRSMAASWDQCGGCGRDHCDPRDMKDAPGGARLCERCAGAITAAAG
jgi:hypothetical protein